MPKFTTKKIMDRIGGMSPIRKPFINMVKKEPVLVVEENEKRYWAILDNGELTTPECKIKAEEIINNNGTIYVIGGPISTEE